MSLHLSAVAVPPDCCGSCNLDPCVCTYIAKLATGGEFHHLYAVALEQHPKPMPHRGGCPCPRCISACTATYRCSACTGDARGNFPCTVHRKDTTA